MSQDVLSGISDMGMIEVGAARTYTLTEFCQEQEDRWAGEDKGKEEARRRRGNRSRSRSRSRRTGGQERTGGCRGPGEGEGIGAGEETRAEATCYTMLENLAWSHSVFIQFSFCRKHRSWELLLLNLYCERMDIR